jgi:hypothetical protein
MGEEDERGKKVLLFHLGNLGDSESNGLLRLKNLISFYNNRKITMEEEGKLIKVLNQKTHLLSGYTKSINYINNLTIENMPG